MVVWIRLPKMLMVALDRAAEDLDGDGRLDAAIEDVDGDGVLDTRNMITMDVDDAAGDPTVLNVLASDLEINGASVATDADVAVNAADIATNVTNIADRHRWMNCYERDQHCYQCD